MWHKLGLSTLIALLALTAVGAQPPWPRDRDRPRREPPPIPRQERDYRDRDGREVWRYSASGGGSFEHLRGRQWAEYRANGAPFYYREVARTRDYVELLDEGRNLSARIYPDRLYQYRENEGWVPIYDGRWE